jgi:hypothetical protein
MDVVFKNKVVAVLPPRRTSHRKQRIGDEVRIISEATRMERWEERSRACLFVMIFGLAAEQAHA